MADTTRREVLKKAVFVAPVILTLSAVPSFASAGSYVGPYEEKTPQSPLWQPPVKLPLLPVRH